MRASFSEYLIAIESQNSIKDTILRLCGPVIKKRTESLQVKLKTEVVVKCCFQMLPVFKVAFQIGINRVKQEIS